MKPYYENENGKLYCGDCLNLFKNIKNKSIDMIITSPPYNMNLRIRNGEYCSRQIVKEISTKYKNFNDNLTIEEYLIFNKKVINECLRVSNIVFYNVQFLTGNKRALFKLIGEFSDNLKEIIIWDKVNSQPAIGGGILNSQFEVILIFESTDKAISRKFNSATFERGTVSNVFKIKRGKKINKNHGAVFPHELVEKIINNFSTPGQVILDPFSGTGTTFYSCVELDRKFVGFELDKELCEDIKLRIEAETKQMKLF